MSIDERSRHELYLKLEAVLGAAEADTLMAHLPPTTFAELVSQRDLDRLGVGMRGEMAELGASLRLEMADLRTGMSGEIDTFRTDMRREFNDFRTGMQSEFNDFRTMVHGEMAGFHAGLADVRTEIARSHAATMRIVVAVQLVGILSMIAIVVTALSLG